MNIASLTGTVTDDGRPVSHATVTASGSNLIAHTTTDAQGRFSFPSLGFGTYTVSATANGLRGELRVDLSSGGATITLALGLKVIGKVAVARSAPVRGAGTDVVLNNTVLTRSPSSDSFPETLIQLPGAVRGANGVVHINGDHGVIDYLIDGVPLPQALNREIGSEIDPNDVSFVDAIEGAYPAQYGLRFGSVLNITTRSGTGSPGLDGNARFGSYTDLDETLGYHAPLAGAGGISLAFRDQQSSRGTDPPNFGSPHNNSSDTNQFARVTLPRGANDFTDITAIHSFRTIQIPNDTGNGEPASTDDNEKQEDTFLNVQFRHALGQSGALSFGPALKVSRVRDFGDPANDFTFGEALNAAAGGNSTDCAAAISSGNYGPTTCAFSLADDKTSVDYILQGDYSQRLGQHEIRAGVAYDGTRVTKNYAVTLQPNNFLAPILSPGSPDVPITVVDDNPNIGNTYESYVQDSWRLGERYELDYGLRYDFFRIKSTDFAQGFGGFSPRLKLTRFFGRRASVYAYLGRFFEPFSFENVDPKAAQLLNLPLQPTVAQFDLKPERDTQIEFGGHVPVGLGSLGFRIWQKNANDLIDDTQVGVTLLHQDINYVLGRLSQEAVDYVEPLTNNGRAYVNVAHTVSLNKGCETQLLAPCFGSPTDFTPADHDQSYSITGGVLFNDRRDGWFSGDAEYGSGLSSAICPPTTPGFCKKTPHTIFAIEKGIGIGPQTALTFRIQNLFNDRYFVTILNAQGNHYAPPRTFDIGVRFGQ
ncbi:MAG: TonB-dependent receptor [Candidatus Eremiobacteraeota bacterium]|nr:TonB-dependent receptor [Candidatus Eremiobacteraeota bacterium]